MSSKVRFSIAPILLVAAMLAGCHSEEGHQASSPWLPAAVYANRCSFDNPYAEAASRTRSRAAEQSWFRAVLEDRYLWPEDLPRLSPSDARYQEVDYDTALDRWLGDHVRAPSQPAGRDRFSGWTAADKASASNAGETVGWSMRIFQDEAGRILVSMVEEGGAAASAGLQRGDQLVALNGWTLPIEDPDVGAEIGNLLVDPPAGARLAFTVQRGGETLQAALTAGPAQAGPVSAVRILRDEPSGLPPVGYLVFEGFDEPAEQALPAAFQTFLDAGVQDVVIDLRYNGGGMAYVAAQLAYMVAGPAPQDKPFNNSRMNPRRLASGESDFLPFLKTYCALKAEKACPEGQIRPLPTLNLRRVFVLTGSESCSASELLINGLRGVDIEVIQIGETTCGKPYGYEPVENCGVSYAVIDSQAANAKGFGQYGAGFQPGGSGETGLPGCVVADDFSHQLGDPREARLAAALRYRHSGQCPVPGMASAADTSVQRQRARERSEPLNLSRPASLR